jgi:hypothetical protein
MRRSTSQSIRGEHGSAVLGATAMKVVRATGAPALPTAAYTRVFEELAGPWGEGLEPPLHFGKLVRDRTAERGPAISRTAANAVIRHLVFSGYRYPQTSTAQDLATAFLDGILTRCGEAGLSLSPTEIADLAAWIGAPVPTGAVQAPAA